MEENPVHGRECRSCSPGFPAAQVQYLVNLTSKTPRKMTTWFCKCQHLPSIITTYFCYFCQMSTLPIYNHHFWHQKTTFVDSFTKMDAFSRFPASRAWFPAQGSISSLQSSDRSAGQPRWRQMLPDAARWCQMLPDAAGGSQMPSDAASSDAARCLQMMPGASRCCQMIPDVTDDPRCCQMLPAQMPPDARCWLMLPIPTPMPIPTPTQTPIQMPTPTTIPTPIPIQISTYNQKPYPYRFRVLPKGNFRIFETSKHYGASWNSPQEPFEFWGLMWSTGPFSIGAGIGCRGGSRYVGWW